MYGFEAILGEGGTPGFGLTHDHIGPFGSIDAFFVPAPPSLLVLSSVFTLAITTWMQTQDAFNAAMTMIPSLTVDPVPMKWQSTEPLRTWGATLRVRLEKQLVLSDDDKWDFFGWVYMFEWAEVSPEVVSFEGDNGIFALVSDKSAPLIYEAQDLEVPKSACQYVWVI
ncbi:hypothetical protein DYB37_002008 [Aphanomyces astaci]|uniref:Uncharacterized protein n=1 Tax=Aphanomyces astaci TaxID=112090 RepID=A0A397A0F4_APHAT|nr:hypothetical protein DYB36_013711 [Aphanomyces astaci]RHY88754.1 hypothetical protein DYB35_008385 [Aphanomyces astaci]RHY98733.1 hypothetical protein DYB26_011519 [Aphanomyces astaci]RHZ15668.1 hypothetical protein DYB37_002008 [Aphanomyces astaci]